MEAHTQGELAAPPATVPETRRGRIYQVLRDAGPTGATTLDLIREGCGGTLAPHLESLRFEGHAIEQTSENVKYGCGLTQRYTLTKDAWTAP